MKFTVIPLGGARSDVGRVVDGFVRYVEPQPAAGLSPTGPAPAGGEGAFRYYADRG